MTNTKYAAIAAGALVFGSFGGGVLGYKATSTGLWGGLPSRPAAEAVQAQRFELVNQNGERRAVLGVGLEGEPTLALYAKNGTVRVELGLQPDGRSTLLFFDQDKQVPRAGLALLPNGSPSLELSDKAGTLRTTFGLGGDGAPILGGFDEQGNLSTVFDLNQDASALMLEPEDGVRADEFLCDPAVIGQKVRALPPQLVGPSAAMAREIR